MEATITCVDKPLYLLVIAKGDLKSAADLVDQANMIYAEFIKFDHTKILIDQTQTTFPTKLFPYLDLVDHYVTLPIMLLKIAVVLTEEYKGIGEFWETACTNRGYQYFAFTSFEEAEEWLIE